jgi:hypothetical protein
MEELFSDEALIADHRDSIALVVFTQEDLIG